MNRAIRILVLGDWDENVAAALSALSQEGCQLRWERVGSIDSFEAALTEEFHLFLLVSRSDSDEAPLLVKRIRQTDGQRPLLVLAEMLTEAFFCKTIAAGATDCLEARRPRQFVIAVERALRERQLQEHLQEQTELLDFAQDAIFVLSFDNIVRFWNRGAERLYGWSSAEAKGRPIRQLISKEGELSAPVQQRLIEKGEWAGEMTQVCHDKSEIVVKMRCSLLRDNQGKSKSVLVTSHDVTEAKKLESRLMRAQRLESLGTLASGIPHDLNNILAPILMSAQILKTQPPDEEADSLLETIESSAQRGADIVKQVLTFARGVEGKRALLQPRHLIRDLLRLLRETFPKTIQVYGDTKRDLWPVMGDATQLQQVLINLSVNARDAMTEGGRLTIHSENFSIDQSYAETTPEAQPGPHVLVEVADTGRGIDSEDLEKIFDPFFTTKEAGKGTGLGLSTVAGIVRSHHGFIQVKSQPHKGTTFKVFLPATPNAPVLDGDRSQTDVPIGQGEIVLVVDDETHVRTMLSKMLSQHGYEVLLASDGSEAIVMLAQHAKGIRLILTDILMPFMDGVALMRAIRKMDQKTGIIAMSGHDSGLVSDDVEQLTRELRIGQFLRKPFNREKLLRAVRDELDK